MNQRVGILQDIDRFNLSEDNDMGKGTVFAIKAPRDNKLGTTLSSRPQL